ncbi:MAG: DUF4345 domain-containing protein [Actinomycetota bacterium]|nr:DUF4345 domain-containing protein [Actinomycetota bacterium]
MKRTTEIWLGLLGCACAVIGLVHLVFGAPTIIGGGPVNATIDSELRFYALLFIAYGAAFVWCALDVTRRARLANVLGAVFFAGGAARLIAWAAAGRPNWFYLVMIGVELLIPLVNYALLRRVQSMMST